MEPLRNSLFHFILRYLTLFSYVICSCHVTLRHATLLYLRDLIMENSCGTTFGTQLLPKFTLGGRTGTTEATGTTGTTGIFHKRILRHY